jgi:hypothetical protein
MKTLEAPKNGTSETGEQVFLDRHQYAARWGRSARWLDSLVSRGLPYVAITKRSLRFDPPVADRWILDRFSTARLGQVNGSNRRSI